MASLINNLAKGIIIKCSMCTGPIKYVYFTHLCEFNPSRVSNGILPNTYCFECLKEKETCKQCGFSYLAKHAMSL